MAMNGFMQRYGRGVQQEKPKSSFSSYEEKAEDHSESTANFIKTYGRMGDQYEFVFKNDDGSTETVKMRFDKDEHVYYRIALNVATGEVEWVKVPGITTILGIKDKSAALMPWVANETVDYVKADFLNMQDGDMEQILASPQLLQEWLFDTLDHAKKAYKNRSTEATDVGKAAHDWLEDYVLAKIAPFNQATFLDLEVKRSTLDERAISCIEAALSWMRAHNVRWMYTERKLYSRKRNCAGTLDGVCTVDSCDDPECCPKPFKDVLSIIDWKSSNALYEAYRWQTAAYEEAIEEELGLDVRHRWVIKLGKFDGAFEKWHITEEDFEMDLRCFLACLELTNAADDCVDTLRDRKRAAKAKAKAEREAAEVAEKMRKAKLRADRKAVRARAKNQYKMHRDLGKSVKLSIELSERWLVAELALLGGDDVDDEEKEKKAA